MARPLAARIVVSLWFGRFRRARFEGESRAVLAALAMVMICIFGVAYLCTTSQNCSSQAVKFGTALFTETTKNEDSIQ
jgi:hypothetical protein